jgi:hypothetical protein
MVFSLLLCAVPVLAQGKPPAEEKPKQRKPEQLEREAKRKYAIVVTNSLFADEKGADAKWQKVVKELKKKYSAKVFKFDGLPHSNETLKKELADYHPYYVCFVSKPQHCGRNFAKSVIRFMRALDSDPYDDAIWAILTGYTADDALKIVKAEPLEVKRHLSHVGGGWLEWFERGVSFNEGKQFEKTVKEKGKKPQKAKGPGDTTEQWVKDVNSNKVDLISTSGHATERDWQMGYNYRSGKIVPAGKGKLAGVASNRQRFGIKTSNPKIYFSPGNCLIAHIPSNLMDCMCLSWIHNGCYHFFGHVGLQGRMCTAWGIGSYFFALQDTFTFAEAVYVNRIASRYVNEHHQTGREKQGYDRCLGITVLYGDPAWQAKMKRTTDPLYEIKLDIAEGEAGRKKLTMTVELKRKCKFNARYTKPPIALLPYRISGWKVEKPDAVKTVVADNFIMLDLTGKEYQKGDKVIATVTCKVHKQASVDATKAKNYAYLSSDQDSSPLVQVGSNMTITDVPFGSVCFHKGTLWSRYLRFDPKTKSLSTYDMPEATRFQTGGFCSDGNLLWLLDTRLKKLRGFAVEEKEGKLQLSPSPANVLDLPCREPTAVTFTNGSFYVLDKTHKKVFVIDKKGQTRGGFPAPSETVTDMAYDGRYFWVVDEKRKAAYMFEEHGVIILYLPLQFVPKGIAYDGKSLWISTAAKKNTLYRFRLNEKQKYTLGGWMEAEVAFRVTGNSTCHVALPENSNRQKIVAKIALSKTAQIMEDNWQQKAAKFAGGGEWRLRARLHQIRYNIIPEQVGDFSKIPEAIRKAYTVDGKMLKLTSEPVKEAKQEVEQLVKKWKKKRNPYWVARCAYEYLIRKVHYERTPGWVDAPTLLVRTTGTCSPISFAYVAICRALGLPARFSAGTRYRGKDPCVDQEFHRWCEVYLPNYGWVPVDPSATGKSPSPLTAVTRWGHVPNTDLVMTRGGGGSTVFGWAYNAAGGRMQAHWSNIERSKK